MPSLNLWNEKDIHRIEKVSILLLTLKNGNILSSNLNQNL
jgi:hypothetical protein